MAILYYHHGKIKITLASKRWFINTAQITQYTNMLGVKVTVTIDVVLIVNNDKPGMAKLWSMSHSCP